VFNRQSLSNKIFYTNNTNLSKLAGLWLLV